MPPLDPGSRGRGRGQHCAPHPLLCLLHHHRLLGVGRERACWPLPPCSFPSVPTVMVVSGSALPHAVAGPGPFPRSPALLPQVQHCSPPPCAALTPLFPLFLLSWHMVLIGRKQHSGLLNLICMLKATGDVPSKSFLIMYARPCNIASVNFNANYSVYTLLYSHYHSNAMFLP